jgi:hypothetical protein
MNSPREKALGYTVVVIVAGVVLAVIVATIAERFVAMPVA